MVPGYDATDGGGAGGGAPTLDDAHGTGCAGIAAAITDNSLGVAGIAREAKIMPVRIFYEDGSGTLITSDSWIADAIDWAVANGADVLSNSWGGGSPATVVTEAIADAKSLGRGGLGAVVVFAAGNNNGPVIYPGRLDTVLAVAATSPCDERKAPTSCDGEFWWGSCQGPEVDIAAPGVHMYTTDASGPAGYDAGDYNYNFNGTSSATPVVAGVAALLLGQDPTMTAAEVEAQLMATADDLATPGWDEGTGFGRVNAYRALVESIPTCYQLTLGHSGLGGDPTAMPPASPGCAAGRYFAGETVTLAAAPAAGWIVNSWSGTDNNGSTSITNTVTMPASSHSAQVNYAQIPCYTLTLGHSGSGTDPAVNPASSAGCNPGAYHPAEVVTLVANPAAGWAIGGWSGTNDDGSFAPNNTVTIPAANHSAAVSYVAVPAGCYVLHRRHSGSGSDPIPTPWNSSGCPGGTYSAGETIALAAAAADDWTVGGWMGTDDDGSFLWANTLDMPASDHTALVRYVTPTLVKDVRSGPQGAFNRDDGSIVSYTTPASIGSTLFFAGNDGVHGVELWKSDGSAAGTVLVKDIWPGTSSAFPWSTSLTWFSQTFVNVGGTLFFVARDGVHDYEVWKSNGTAAGTVMVKDIYNSWDQLPSELTNVNGTLFFSHTDGTHGVELWKSNGTAAGTVMVKDINPGAGDSDPEELAEFNGQLVFSADDGSHGQEPWISNGTDAGTMMLKDIDAASSSGPGDFTQVGTTVFFSAANADYGLELWKSDGTEAGTVVVKNIAPSWYGSRPSELEVMNGALFFRATDNGLYVDHGVELWKSDGTEAGTVMIKDIWPGSKDSWPRFMTNVDGMILFKANTADQGFWGGELWKSDGTEPGTVMVKDIYPNPNPTNMWPEELTEVGGSLLFTADDAVHGRELWWSDSSQAGTSLVRDINIGGYGSSPDWFIDADGVVFFRAFEGVHGREIWALVDPSDCHLLMVGHTGMGSNPVLDPSQSAGCNPGFFETGEVVTLTASPDSGWFVGSWSGSDNDGSTSMVNTVTMPGVNHTVTVNYGAYPIFVDGFESGNTSAWSKTVP
jgi:ELWxxDGT repeat protein